MIPRRLPGPVLALVITVLLASCVQVPKEVDAPAPNGPALTTATHREWMIATSRTLDRFFDANDADQLDRVFDGIELDFWQAWSAHLEELDEPWGWSGSPDGIENGWTVYASQRGSYPQRAVTVRPKRGKKTPESTVEFLIREDAGSPWRAVFSFTADIGAHRPRVHRDRPRVLVPAEDEKIINELTAPEVRLVVAQALNQPHSPAARRIKRNGEVTDAQKATTADKDRKHSNSTVSVGADSTSYSFPTADGGRITMGMLRIGHTTVLQDGWYQSFNGPQKNLLPAKGYQSYTRHSLMTFAVYVPPRGKLVLLSTSSATVDLTGVEYDFDGDVP